jgi:hypothetical protein
MDGRTAWKNSLAGFAYRRSGLVVLFLLHLAWFLHGLDCENKKKKKKKRKKERIVLDRVIK